jgi:hypothetical protein
VAVAKVVRPELDQANGYFCPGYGRPAHEAYDLTFDHRIPLRSVDAMRMAARFYAGAATRDVVPVSATSSNRPVVGPISRAASGRGVQPERHFPCTRRSTKISLRSHMRTMR